MATMSFARAFSTKRNKPDMEITPSPYVGRAASQRAGRPVVITQISSPTELISTSNVHVQTAQTIAGARPIEIRKISGSSIRSSSSDESDASSNSAVSDGTLTDASSIDESPVSYEPKPNQLSSCFSKTASGDKNPADRCQTPVQAVDPDVTPKIPQRSPSRRSSPQVKLAPPPAIKEAATRSSFDIVAGLKPSTNKGLFPSPQFQQDVGHFRPQTAPQLPRIQSTPTTFLDSPQHSPFDAELAQLQEIAEEFGQTVRSAEEDEDVMHMEKHGLASFSASEYMSEIQSLVHAMFADEQPFFKQLGGFF